MPTLNEKVRSMFEHNNLLFTFLLFSLSRSQMLLSVHHRGDFHVFSTVFSNHFYLDESGSLLSKLQTFLIILLNMQMFFGNRVGTRALDNYS